MLVGVRHIEGSPSDPSTMIEANSALLPNANLSAILVNYKHKLCTLTTFIIRDDHHGGTGSDKDLVDFASYCTGLVRFECFLFCFLLSEGIIAVLNNNPGIVHLYLATMCIAPQEFHLIADNFPKLTTFHCREGNITDADLAYLSKRCPKLVQLSLLNKFSGIYKTITTKGIKTLLHNCKYLEVLNCPSLYLHHYIDDEVEEKYRR